LFFLRHFNDIDNIAPAIYFFLEDDVNNRADVVLYREGYDFRNDPNLRFLKLQFGDRFTYSWLGEFFGLSMPGEINKSNLMNKLDNLLYKAAYKTGFSYENIANHYQRARERIGRYKKPSVKKIRMGQVDNSIIQSGLKKILAHPVWPSLVVFDINRSGEVAGLTNNLRALGIKKIICLPVSPLINYNVMREKNLTDVFSDTFKQMHDYSAFDALGYVDEHFVESYNQLFHLIGHQSDLIGKTMPLGSLRYSFEWLAIRNEMIAPYAGHKSSKPIKILFLLSRSISNVNVEEVLITFEILNSFSEFDVLVKGHPRENVAEMQIRFPNLSFAGNTDSSALINWSDIILFWSTSVAIEGYIKEKAMVCLRYIVSNKNLYARYDAGYVAHCRDDLISFLLYYRNRHTVPPSYNNEGKQRFLDDIVWAKHKEKSVADLYLDFMRENEWM